MKRIDDIKDVTDLPPGELYIGQPKQEIPGFMDIRMVKEALESIRNRRKNPEVATQADVVAFAMNECDYANVKRQGHGYRATTRALASAAP